MTRVWATVVAGLLLGAAGIIKGGDKAERIGRYYGFVDVTGTAIIPPWFDDVDASGNFKKGPVWVKHQGHWGAVNRSGTWILPPKFDEYKPFVDGVAPAKVGRYWCIVNEKGAMVSPPTFPDLSEFSNDLAVFSFGKTDDAENPLFGAVDANGRIVVKDEFQSLKSFSDGLAAATKGDRRGYVDKTGAFVIEGDWDDLGQFSEGLAAASKDKKYGYIDKTGKWVIPPTYYAANPFREGLARIGIPPKQAPKFPTKDGEENQFTKDFTEVFTPFAATYGFIDRTGKVVIEPKYSFMSFACHEGLVGCLLIEDKPMNERVVGGKRFNSRFFYFDKTGKPAFSLKLTIGTPFVDGKATVMLADETPAIIDRKGRIVRRLKPTEDDDAHFPEPRHRPEIKTNRFTIEERGLSGLIDREGHVIVSCEYDRIQAFHFGRAIVVRNGRYGVIDVNGKTVVPCAADWLADYSGGMCRFWKDGKFGYIDVNGKVALPAQYDMAWDFTEGLARVAVGMKTNFINRKGAKLLKTPVDQAGAFHAGFAPIMIGKKWGVINRTGKMTVKPQVDFIDEFDDKGVAGACNNGKWGVISGSCKVILQFKLSYPPSIQNGCIIAQLTDDRYSVYSYKGKCYYRYAFDKPDFFSDGLMKLGGWTYMDTKGGIHTIVPESVHVARTSAEAIKAAKERVARFKKEGLSGMMADAMTTKFNQWNQGRFVDGLAPFVSDQKSWGYFDKKGHIAIKPRFYLAYPFFDGLAKVSLDDRRDAYVDRSGKLVWTQKHPLDPDSFGIPSHEEVVYRRNLFKNK